MTAFVGFAANAGGLYVKKFNTLFTFQRTEKSSYISVEELILHEFGHYLQGCYVLPGTFGSEHYDEQPKGFLDEGLAEFWGTLNFDKKGCYSLPLRENYMKRVCRNGLYPEWSLNELVNARKGYDESGVFHYMRAYTLNYFLATQHMPVLQTILKLLRNDTYRESQWENVTGKSISEWDTLWHNAIRDYCNPKKIQVYPWECPVTDEDDKYASCALTGHGYSTTLWNTADGTDAVTVRRRRTVMHLGVDRKKAFSAVSTSVQYRAAFEREDSIEEADLGESGLFVDLGTQTLVEVGEGTDVVDLVTDGDVVVSNQRE